MRDPRPDTIYKSVVWSTKHPCLLRDLDRQLHYHRTVVGRLGLIQAHPGEAWAAITIRAFRHPPPFNGGRVPVGVGEALRQQEVIELAIGERKIALPVPFEELGPALFLRQTVYDVDHLVPLHQLSDPCVAMGVCLQVIVEVG